MVTRRLLGALLLSISAISLAEPSHPASPLTPVRTLVGGLPASGGGYVKFIYPSAVAIGAGELYVLDSGLGALLAVDLTTERVRTIASMPGLPAVSLQSAPGGGVFVLRPDLGVVQRLDRNGRELARLSAQDAMLQPRGIALSPDGTQAWITDADGSLHAFGGLGRQAYALPGAAEPTPWRMIKSGGGRAWGIADDCLCLAEVGFDGRELQRFDDVRFDDPGAMSVDRDGRVWLVDNADGHLQLHVGGQRLGLYAPASLGANRITALANGPGSLYVADGPGARIIELRLSPMARNP